MKNICFHCGKGILMGRQHTHHRGVAGGRWKKRAPKTAKAFAPNLQKVKVMVGGVAKQVKLCTKCIKRIKKDIADGVKPFVTLASLEKGVAERKAAHAAKAPKKAATKAKKS
jgi:ribosomal protein L28